VTAPDSHQRITEAFSAYVDGDLAPAERTHVDEHLATCMQCRVSLERFRRTVGRLGALKRTAPVSFLENVQAQINRRSRGRFFSKRALLFGRIPFEWISLAMIVAMLVYYIVVLQTSPTGVVPGK
jgi:Predicted transmembrane transcriptional regulator (anti-sigma factor)